MGRRRRDPDPFANFDLERWLGRFRVRLRKLPGDLVAIHHLTSFGRGRHLPVDEIWIDPAFGEWKDIITLHEGIENYLRRHGWTYDESHDFAMETEFRVFGGTPRYERYLGALHDF